MFNFKDLKKIVINLDKRLDKLSEFQKEMDYVGWDYIRFSAIDTSSYIGCALSHQEISKDFLENSQDEYLLVMEDDLFFMPYAKKLLKEIENELVNNEWDFFHLGPTLHRPVSMFNKVLVDLTNVPPKDEIKHRGIFGTTAFILTKKSAEIVLNWNTNKYIENKNQLIPIDDYFYKVLYKKCKSFAPYLPIVTQTNNFSDIGNTFYNNHYCMTYNWNHYAPNKIEKLMFDIETCKKLKL